MRYSFVLFLLITLVACGGSGLEEQKTAVLTTYANIVHATYDDAYQTAVTLQTTLTTFVNTPTAETHQAAKDAWLAARIPYGQSEAFRFAGGPIDNADGPEGQINAWPMDEAYVDYVVGDNSSGIINNPTDYPEITAELLISLNEAGAEENISLGYHAIEFLLWGQDLRDDGAGERPFTDYTTAASRPGDNADRRGQYLLITANLLVQNLHYLVQAWEPNQDNYRAQFLAQDPDTALQQILTGIGVLSKSELAGERMFVAYDNQDQEDEHSCFSDNTHNDIRLNAQGIYNVYSGSYTRLDGTIISGPSLADLLQSQDADLAKEVEDVATAVLQAVNAIQPPFDQAIISDHGRQTVIDAVFLLQDQGDQFVALSQALGLQINTNLP